MGGLQEDADVENKCQNIYEVGTVSSSDYGGLLCAPLSNGDKVAIELPESNLHYVMIRILEPPS